MGAKQEVRTESGPYIVCVGRVAGVVFGDMYGLARIVTAFGVESNE